MPPVKYLKSPLNYTGGKHKLLPQIIPNLPQDTSIFVDLFCGGCNVAINAPPPFKKIICNDREQKLIEIYRYFQATDIKSLLGYIHERINCFRLSKTDKEAYGRYRNFYNRNQHPLDLFVLICFSFSHYYRFNSKGEYNNPSGAGRSAYNPVLEANLVQFVEAIKRINFYDYDFLDIYKDSLTPDHFVFCDPPYNITFANYGLSWDMRYEFSLYAFLNDLNRKGIKFALTNVSHHKGSVNKILLDFARNYRIIELNSSYANSSYHTKREPSREIMVVNY